MPKYVKKYNKRRRRRRRRYKRGSRTTSNAIVISKNPSPLGRSFRTKLRYYERGYSLNSSGSTVQYVFSANGLYDPDISGVGHQPLGFDQLMLMYDHAVVIGSKITVNFENTDTTYSQMVSIHAQDNSTSYADMPRLIENGTCVYSDLNNRDASGSNKTLYYKINPNKFLNRSKPLSDPDLKNSDSSNPTEQVFYIISARPNSGTDVNIIYFSVLIEYEVVFIEPKQLTQS